MRVHVQHPAKEKVADLKVARASLICHILYSWHVYNDDNKEKVKHDEEKDRILKEIEQEKRKQDGRTSRLDLLRKRKADPLSSTDLAPKECPTDPKVGNEKEELPERFSLFPEDSMKDQKKTKTQKEVEERESWVKPVGFADVKVKSAPWYSKPKEKVDNNGINANEYETKPTVSKKSPSIEELRRKRVKRESEEREKAEKILRNKR